MTCVIAAIAMGVMADNTVNVTKFHQSYPYSGKATIEYTLGGTLPANAVTEIVLNTDDASVTFIQSNIVAGANSHVIDFAASFGGALLLTNASFVVTIAGVELGGVQLWENGPYWAECNVGATKPEEYGYYFWWGDTVGYTRSGGTWTDDIYYDGVTWVSSTGEQMSNSPFTTSCPTYNKDNAELLLAGYIDSTGNLVAVYDAATSHLGSPWRLPTDAEFSALVSNCITTWITTNGVRGRLVMGRGDYANRSIFLPAAGNGSYSTLLNPGTGVYWSSTPYSVTSYVAWDLDLAPDNIIGKGRESRFCGLSVRPVRGFAGVCSASGVVAYDPPPVTETQMTPVPVPYAWLEAHVPGVAHEYEAYEAAAEATAANGRKVWECYVVGLAPSDPLDDFRITRFWMDGDVPMFEFNHTTDGSGNSFLPYVKPLGKAKLMDAWLHVPDGGNPAFRFFAVEVVPPGCVSSVVEEEFGDVQLWENGPYWAKCNVGATKSEENGYYFWWGDTVGYTNTGSGWISVKDGTSFSFRHSGTAGSTNGKDNSALLSAGYIDSTGNLVAAHDAATAHLGSPWRMPTDAEFSALISNCTTTWTTRNGVYGRLVTGKGDYADRSIFLPAAGLGSGSSLGSLGLIGIYWSSTPYSDFSGYAWNLHIDSSNFSRSGYSRYGGQPVRPVRGFAK